MYIYSRTNQIASAKRTQIHCADPAAIPSASSLGDPPALSIWCTGTAFSHFCLPGGSPKPAAAPFRTRWLH